MIKFSSTDDFNCDVEPVSLVTDDKQLTKRGSVKEQLKYEKTADQTDVHVIALGAHEGYGANRNSDAFMEKDCRERHHTFKQANRAVHYNHKNKPTDPKFGNIKASAYNENMKRIELIMGLDNDNPRNKEALEKLASGKQIQVSMACRVPYDTCTWCHHDAKDDSHRCFIAGTLIETRAGLKAIEEVVIGDEVKTHKGRWRKVSQIFKNSYSGDLITFRVPGMFKTITVTPGHPFLSIDEKEIKACNGTVRDGKIRRHTLDATGVCVSCGATVTKPDWKNSDKLNVGDFLACPTIISPELGVNYDVEDAYILGLFLGDGCYIKDGGKYPDGTLKRLGLAFTFDNAHPAVQENLKNVKKYKITERFEEGTNYKNYSLRSKFLAEEAYRLCGEYSKTKTLSEEIFTWTERSKLAFIAGYLDSDGCVNPESGAVRFTTSSINLAYTFRQLLSSLGFSFSTQWSFSYGFDIKTVEPTCKCYSTGLGSYYAEALKPYAGKLVNFDKFLHKSCKLFFAHAYYFVPIKEKNVEIVKDIQVYNFEVEDDHSYIANGLAVHNCDHIPSQLGELNKQGEMCAMQNYKPDWFEISIVGRPADRIGHSLNSSTVKEASYKRMSTQDYLEMYPGFYCEENEVLTLSKKASNKRNLLKKLSEMEKKLDGIGQSKKTDFISRQAAHLNKSPKISDFAIDEMRKHEPSKVFKATADKGIIFNPEEFIRYALGDAGTPDIAKGMRKHLPKGFSKAEDKGEPSTLHDEKYSPAELDFLPKGLKDLVSNLTEGHSLFGEPSTRRVISITISSFGKAPEKKKEENTKESSGYNFEKLAQEYTSYKLAQLEYLDDQGKLDDIFLYNCLIQNRN